MKTKLLYILLISVLMGCSNDDDSNQEPEIPADQKFADRIDIINEEGDSSQFINFEYNTNKQISKLNFSTAFTLDYTYENNRLTGIDFLSGEGLVPFEFEYDNAGTITSLIKDGAALNVAFDNATNMYTMELNAEESVTFTINENEDVEEIQFLDEQNMPEDTFTSVYDGQYNGTMTNTLNIQLATSMILSTVEDNISLLPYPLLYISKKPVITIAFTGIGVINYTNTYDSQSFLDTIKFNGAGGSDSTSKVIYQQIE